MSLLDRFPTINIITTGEPRAQPGNSLDDYRTVMFDLAIMRQMITFDWFPVNDPQYPWRKSAFGPVLGTWLCAVPQVYREKVVEIARKTFKRVLQGEVFKEHHKDLFIHELRVDIWTHLEPIFP